MLQNAYFLAKIGADTAENEQHFAENLPKIDNYPTGRAAGADGTADCTGLPRAWGRVRLERPGARHPRRRGQRGEDLDVRAKDKNDSK